MKEYKLYRARHISGKFYIGITSQSLKQRESQHWNARGRPKFRRFLLTTERLEWSWEVLETQQFETLKEAIAFEEKKTEELWDEEYILNSKKGNNGESEEVRRQRSKSAKKRVQPKRTSAWKENNSKAQPNRRPVKCLETGKEYNSISRLLKEINCKTSRKMISQRFKDGSGIAIIKKKEYQLI